jgi:serine/threonine protein phosphatase 1
MLEFSPAPASLPAGRRVYAIGDVHGCDDRLAVLHAAIADDLAARPCAAPLLLHLGDYVDRGPDSRGVVARLAAGDPLAGVPTVNLMGNHEATMLDALSGQGAAMTDWMIAGGREALASWGGDPDAPRESWAAHVPGYHMMFLRELALMHAEGGYLFVHAGIRPGVAVGDQLRQDLLSIRQAFLYSEADFGVVVVHGHTPKEAPVLRHNRIGIDTGAVFGGRLTCAVLEEDRVGFLFA